MIYAISYADSTYRPAQKLNSRHALSFGADRVREFGPDDIDEEFKTRNLSILQQKRGNGYWLWKPYIILSMLDEISYGDILLYSDSGSAIVSPISPLINIMNKDNVDIMPFSIEQIERKWDKRDALVLMDCDNEEYLNSPQICATYILLKKTEYSLRIVKEWLEFCQDERIITDNGNTMGLPNYQEFVENRHDQTVWSLVCKKNGIVPYRDPSQWGEIKRGEFPQDILDRSIYPQIFESHRRGYICHECQLDYGGVGTYKKVMRKILRGIDKIIR